MGQHNLKRKLREEEIDLIPYMLNTTKMSLGQVARHFKVNKPRILKSVGLWKK